MINLKNLLFGYTIYKIYLSLVEGAKGLIEPFCKKHCTFFAFGVCFTFILYIIVGFSFIEVYNEINLSLLSLFIFNTYSVSSCKARCIRAYSTELPEPIKKYENSDIQKFQILEENKGKSGVYLLRNLINKKHM
jgi:hypothetical protein